MKPSIEDIARIVTAQQQKNARFAARVVQATPTGDVLPYHGLTIHQTPYLAWLREHYVVSDASPMVERMRVAAEIALYTPPTETVLITGETGTGKEIFARSFAAGGLPFVSVNCTGLPDYLIESELFGHVAGSFTGALSTKRGLLQVASNGVLLLDEIGDMPVHLQPKLLRAIQERVIRPVGGVEEIPIACRVIAASHQDLRAKLREDLFWRISTHQIHLIPLSERLDDAVVYLTGKGVPSVIVKRFVDTYTGGNFRAVQQFYSRWRLATKCAAAGTPPA